MRGESCTVNIFPAAHGTSSKGCAAVNVGQVPLVILAIQGSTPDQEACASAGKASPGGLSHALRHAHQRPWRCRMLRFLLLKDLLHLTDTDMLIG